jgi:hypothetical protein
MSSLIHFFTEIGNSEFKIPYYVKSTVIIGLIICATVVIIVFNDMFKTSSYRDSYIWYYIIIMFNLINILLIYTYYHYRSNQDGEVGDVGKKGVKGKRGKFKNCGYCKNTLFFQKTKKYNNVCSLLNKYSDAINKLSSKEYKNLAVSDNVDYSEFIIDILIGDGIIKDKINPIHLEYSRLISSIMFQKDLIIELFIYYINFNNNDIRTRLLGDIKRAYGPSRYMVIGDSVSKGGDDFALNSFLVAASGTSETLYPIKYDRLVSFNAYDTSTNKFQRYTIWRPIGQEINGIDNMGDPKIYKYHSVGDVCSYEEEEPDRNLVATINEDCLEIIDDSLLNMVFIYLDSSSITFNMSDGQMPSSYSDLTREFKIDKPTTRIEMFSLWRTPLNTIKIHSINSDYQFTNNTIGYNIVGGRADKIDEYNNVKDIYKKDIVNRLKNIKLNNLQKIFIIVNHYSYIYLNELRYYLYRADASYDPSKKSSSDSGKSSKDKKTENEVQQQGKSIDYRVQGAADIANSAASVKQLLKFIEQKEDENEEFNVSRARNLYKKPNEPHPPMRKLPPYLKRVYQKVQSGLLAIESKLENINNLYELLNDIFPNKLEHRIAIDTNGVAEGGELLNFAQEILLYICKIVNPPDTPSYMIKSDCLGVEAVDKERQKLIKNIEITISKYKTMMNDYKVNPDKYCTSWESIIKFQDLTFNKLGQNLGHIDNYVEKIEKLELDDFTKSRLQIIYDEYNKLNNYIIGNCSLNNE